MYQLINMPQARMCEEAKNKKHVVIHKPLFTPAFVSALFFSNVITEKQRELFPYQVSTCPQVTGPSVTC